MKLVTHSGVPDDRQDREIARFEPRKLWWKTDQVIQPPFEMD